MAAITVLSALYGAKHVFGFHQISEEFRQYSLRTNNTDDNILRSLFDYPSLDSHQKILRTEAIFSSAAVLSSLVWVSAVIILNSI